LKRNRASFSGLTFLLGLLIGAGGSLYLKSDKGQIPIPTAASFKGKPSYRVVRVVDGDTVVLLVDGKQEKVRLIGVDTPETVKPNTPVQPYGPEASRFTKNLLTGESVFMETDPGGAGTQDRFKRELAFLYRAPDGLFVNLELVRQGYGRVYRKVKFKYRDIFEEVEATTKAQHKGLWGESE
jgi:micrococcal nuclease